MKTSYVYLILAAVIAAPHLPLWYVLFAPPWFLLWAFYHLAKGD